ncbi:MmgE/PrpD family protein [Alteribacter populi]|uniref:MmgE/PrpD family protein n=1 Tax=Alteribacter populi TaxID=2011011 RepID=UPI000BBB2E35|nr:MmgE/PrpD family protein [Alteribacter populi]
MLTKQLVDKIFETSYGSFEESTILHAKKSLLNWLGVTVGAIEHKSIDMLLEVSDELGSSEQATILGRNKKTDISMAALINGTSSHIFDFDDTHLDTIHHPSGPIAPVVFALGETRNLSTKELLRAFILGCEVELRISNAVYPSHYQKGYHITPTAGCFGAAVAAGILLNLDKEKMVMALGIAGTQAFGLREMFGTMTKPFHPGKAAQNGLLAALLADKGFTSSKQVLEAKRGFANVMSDSHDLTKVLDKWGESYEFEKNAFKPYACGIVLHPSIDACIQLSEFATPEEVESIELTVNPYVLELTGKDQPLTGLEGKFSIYHTGAIAFLEKDAAEEQYSDEKVNASNTVEMRKKIKPVVSEDISEEKVKAVLKKTDGTTQVVVIEDATGSIDNPMTQEMLNKKFTKLCKPIISQDKIDEVIEKTMRFEELDSVNEVIGSLYNERILMN